MESTARNSVLIETKLGKVRGKLVKSILGEDYYSFQGVPYAKAPKGPLRFKAPQPAEPYANNEFDATKEGPPCPSAHMMFLNYIGKEDNCLNLNIYTKTLPKLEENEKKPVMVWIHGGAFIQGANNQDFYCPDFMMMQDVVQVFINYRLGIFGFLSLEDATLDVPGNAGLKDQVMALKWVKQHISNFGGDPNNVTIYGESAGSASVHYLVLSKMAKNLFHKAILQSGSALNPWAQGTKGVGYIRKQLGISEGESEAKILETLNAMCPKKLVKMQMKAVELLQAANKRVFGPVIEKNGDGAFMTEEPLKILESGDYNKVPMVIGFNTNEGMLYELVKKTRNVKGALDFEMEIPYDVGVPQRSAVSAKIAKELEEFYKIKNVGNDEDVQATYDLKSDHHFLVGIKRTTELHLKFNGENAPIYLYCFNYDGDLNYFKKCATSKSLYLYFAFLYMMSRFDSEKIKKMFSKMSNGLGFKKLEGCSHADDLGYLFPTFFTKNFDQTSGPELEYVRQMVGFWTNFARTSDPNKGKNCDGATWRKAQVGEIRYFELCHEPKMIEHPFKKRMEFWDQIYREHKQ